MGLFERQMTSYGNYHSHKTNKILHILGTPFIIYSILVAASHISLPILNIELSGNWIIAIGLSVWYIFFHLLYGGIAALWILGLSALVPYMYQIDEPMHWIVIAVMQIGGWATLFYGHYIEGKKPALFDNIGHIFNAAPFVTAELLDLIKPKK